MIFCSAKLKIIGNKGSSGIFILELFYSTLIWKDCYLIIFLSWHFYYSVNVLELDEY